MSTWRVPGIHKLNFLTKRRWLEPTVGIIKGFPIFIAGPPMMMSRPCRRGPRQISFRPRIIEDMVGAPTIHQSDRLVHLSQPGHCPTDRIARSHATGAISRLRRRRTTAARNAPHMAEGTSLGDDKSKVVYGARCAVAPAAPSPALLSHDPSSSTGTCLSSLKSLSFTTTTPLATKKRADQMPPPISFPLRHPSPAAPFQDAARDGQGSPV